MVTFSPEQWEEIRNRPRAAEYFIQGGLGCLGSDYYLRDASALVVQLSEFVHRQQQHHCFGNHKVFIKGAGTVFSDVSGCFEIDVYHKEDKIDSFEVVYKFLGIGETYRYWLRGYILHYDATIEQVFNRLAKNVKAPISVAS
ncbi:MAG TPA: hypothetical protein VJB58_00095 [Candidatus Paceibacterota bacterium]